MNWKRRSSSSAATVAQIEELLVQILIRVPIKPLIKFKCVSKQWLSLISDSHFCISHTRFQRRLNPKPTAIFFDESLNPTHKLLLNNCTYAHQVIPLTSPTTDEEEAMLPSLDYLYQEVPQFKILQCCNGLVLCRSSFLVQPTEQRSEFWFDDHDFVAVDNCDSVSTVRDRGFRYFICNPTTRLFKRLSFSATLEEKLRVSVPYVNYEDNFFGVCLAFDPERSPHYKIIFIFSVCDARKFTGELVEIFTYSSETDSWTSQIADVAAELMMGTSLTPSNPFSLPFNFDNYGVFCNGAIHWFVCEDLVPFLVYFNIDTVSFKKMELRLDFYSFFFNLMESQDHLQFVALKKNRHHPLEYHILEIAADYSGWSVKYQVNLESISIAYTVPLSDVKVMGIIEAKYEDDKEEEESMFVFAVDGTVLACNLSDGTFKTICCMESRSDGMYHGWRPYQYFESLVCV